MGLAAFLRNSIGAAPQGEVDAARIAGASAADARGAADEMKALVAEIRQGHLRSVEDIRTELERLSARVEAMPEMRAQLETFVQSLGRTMTGAADRLDTVDDRIERLEQQARAQTEIIALTRSELDRQGRQVAGVESQLKSIDEAMARMVAAADRLHGPEGAGANRRPTTGPSDGTNRILIALLVIILIVAIIR